MPSLFQHKLLNGAYGDPVLYINLFSKSFSYLADLGDISNLNNKEILKIKKVFVSHPHMDHFFGFDKLLRIFLGKDKTVEIFGPEPIIKCVEGKLKGYVWNLVDNYKNNFTIIVNEIHHRKMYKAEFRCKEKFKKRFLGSEKIRNRTIVNEEDHVVKCEILDHRTPSICYFFEEKFKINILKNKLKEYNFEVGPWLRELKTYIYAGKLDEEFEYNNKKYKISELVELITKITPGVKIAYITDLVFSKKNIEKLRKIAKDISILYIEATFLNKDNRRARERFHLTAKQAGFIAKLVNAKKVYPMHISPINTGKYHIVKKELINEWKRRVN